MVSQNRIGVSWRAAFGARGKKKTDDKSTGHPNPENETKNEGNITRHTYLESVSRLDRNKKLAAESGFERNHTQKEE